MGRCGYSVDTVTGYKYTFTFDGAEDVLVMGTTNRTLSNGTLVTFNLEVFEDVQKNAAIFPRRRYGMDRPEGVKLLDVQ